MIGRWRMHSLWPPTWICLWWLRCPSDSRDHAGLSVAPLCNYVEWNIVVQWILDLLNKQQIFVEHDHFVEQKNIRWTKYALLSKTMSKHKPLLNKTYPEQDFVEHKTSSFRAADNPAEVRGGVGGGRGWWWGFRSLARTSGPAWEFVRCTIP